MVRDRQAARTRLLLVEDHEQMARLMKCLLEADGFEVRTAGTLAGARELALNQRFDLILSDLGLPDGDALTLPAELARLYAGNGPGIGGRPAGACAVAHGAPPPPAIALSGYCTNEDVERSLGAGFVEHLIKPVDAEALTATIRRVLAAVPHSAVEDEVERIPPAG
ncbi:MAG: response regulator [Planctomycetota bacterium]